MKTAKVYHNLIVVDYQLSNNYMPTFYKMIYFI